MVHASRAVIHQSQRREYTHARGGLKVAPRFCAKGNPYSPPPTQDRDARPLPPGGAAHPGARTRLSITRRNTPRDDSPGAPRLAPDAAPGPGRVHNGPNARMHAPGHAAPGPRLAGTRGAALVTMGREPGARGVPVTGPGPPRRGLVAITTRTRKRERGRAPEGRGRASGARRNA